MALGTRLIVSGYACQGKVAPERAKELLQELVELVNMRTGGMAPQVYLYPLADGSGGIGETVFQPLVESFIVSDAWPALSEPIFYVVIASCRSYEPLTIATFLKEQVGPLVDFGFFKLQGLRKKRSSRVVAQ